MTEEEQKQFDDLRIEVETLKELFYKDNYSNLEVFRKQVQFKSDVSIGASIGSSSVPASGAGKLGFYANYSAPIIQPTTGGASATFVAGVGTAVNDASTFDGYTLKQIVKALRNLGLIA